MFNFHNDWVVENWFAKDHNENNPLHYAYLNDMPEIRQILRQSKLERNETPEKGAKGNVKNIPPNTQMNRMSQIPA